MSVTQYQCIEFCPRGMFSNDGKCEALPKRDIEPNKVLCDTMFAGHVINMSIKCKFSYKLDTKADYYFTGFP